ncbi:hypothetical protein WJX82_001214 [Trebouxia sp. C0006]
MPHNAGISPQLNPKARDRSCSPPNLNRDNTELTDVTVVSGFHAAKRRRRDVDGNHQVIADSARKKQASHTSLSDLVDVASLAVPSLGAVLADPLISLVDTACVGQVSSLQLASLGPNTAIFNLIFQVFAFLSVTTTNVLATNSIQAPGISDKERKRRLAFSEMMLSYTLCVAMMLGLCIIVFLEAVGPWLLTLVGSSADILGPALQYLRIRATASPAVMLVMVAQGACFGQQDAWTPLKVASAVAIINLAGDYYLIIQRGLGVIGAGITCPVAQYFGAIVFIIYLQRMGRRDKGIPLSWQGWPRLVAFRPYLGVATTLLARTLFTMCSYTSITAAATSLGTPEAAAHQVTLQLFWFLSFVPEPLSMAAQSLVARDSSDPARVKRLTHLLLKLGLFAGIVLAALVAFIMIKLPWLFTSDAAVAADVGQLVAQAMCSTLICSIVMMFDGISIGSGDFRHLPQTNLLGWLVTGASLVVGRRLKGGLGSVWWSLSLFFATRLLWHLVHIYKHWTTSAFGIYQRPGHQEVHAIA